MAGQMSKPGKISYEFGAFRLDPAEHILLRDDLAVSLRPKEFAVLLALVEHHGRLMTKDDLLQEVWPGQFVEEGNLNRHVSSLRRALGESSDAPQYVETVPKVGYRFVAPVREIRDLSTDTVIERHTIARIVTEEEEEEEKANGREVIESASEPKALLTTRAKNDRRRRLALAAWLLILIALTLAFAYAWTTRESQQTKTAASVTSLAVLPFKPIGAGDEDEYLGLGMADALITKLGNIQKINIRPTSAVRKYDAPNQDPISAGRELGVEAVIEGSVQRVGGRIRVTVQLVTVKDRTPVWAEKFDEQFTDIFAVQDRISEQVARALTLTLSSTERELLTKHHTENSDAYQLYLKGRYFWNKRTIEALNKGIGYFSEAVQKDPSYALAYVGLADSYSLLSDYDGLPPKEAYPQAKKAAEKALALDDQLAEAHAALGLIKTSYDWDWPGAEREYRRAIELNPNYETAHQWYAEYLSGMGRHQEAITEIRRAKQINPVSLIINAVEVSVLYIAREYDQAISQGQKALEMDPHFAEVYGYLRRCYDQKGMYKEAIAARQMRRKLAGFDAEETATLREAAAAASSRVYWQKRLEQELEESKRELSTAFDMAEIYAQLDEKDQAFASLERAYEERSVMMMYLKVLPNLDPLRTDPRYADLLQRVGHTP